MLLAAALQLPPHRVWHRAARGLGDEYLYFDQLVDHFDNTNTDTFRQRYLLNGSQYAPGGPLLVFIGGEGELPASALGGKYSINYFAEQLGGFMVALEHRYYGSSWVAPGNMSDMRYLSSKQAIADFSRFIPFIKQTQNLPENTKTVVIGGSYSGNLASWLRTQLPFVVDAAIATSGPALGELHYTEYMPHAQAQLEALGGPECFGNLTVALNYLTNLLATDVPAFRDIYGIDRENLDDTLTDLDLWNVESMISNEIVSDIQYYEATGYNGTDFPGTIQQVCGEFTQDLTADSTDEDIARAYVARFPLSDAGNLHYQYFID